MDTELQDLGSDAFDKLEVLMTMEELFSLYFQPTDRVGITTVGDIVALVERSLAEQHSRDAQAALKRAAGGSAPVGRTERGDDGLV